jgi:eukaryotic-like serine/threonine-protein kinase
MPPAPPGHHRVRDGKADVFGGRYALERPIGRGGTGAVWLGRDELLGRPVAMKRLGLLPGDDHTDLARAEREARLSARLNHPHVVAVFDMVMDEETDEHWLVMEYVDGLTLAQMVHDRGRLLPDDAAPLLWQVADGLAAAHAEGIVHRDVKPSNVLVDAEGCAKLTDFGIARVETDESLTRTGLMTGSPAYLAPEIASGGRGDAAADVWSLGATTFHVLAGRPPYEIGDHVLGALYRIVHDDPPRLPEADWMVPLLDATMVKDPSERWTMEQVRDFLSRPDRTVLPTATVAVDALYADRDTRVLDPIPPAPAAAVAALTPSPAEPAPPEAASEGPTRRSPRNVALALGAVAALVLAVVVTTALTGGGAKPGKTGATSLQTPSTQPAAPARPTARGMERFIRTYVATVADDPDQAWTMLTPKFQRESGGLDRYRDFWDDATDGKVLSISANPDNLSVSYQVHFDNFDNGPGPTILDLKFTNGRYLINGERSKGFVPAND